MNKRCRILCMLNCLLVCSFFLCASCAHDPHFTTDSKGTPIWKHGALSFDPKGEWGYVGRGREGVVWMFGHVSGQVWSLVSVYPGPTGQSKEDLRELAMSAMSDIGDAETCADGLIDDQPVLFCRGSYRDLLGTVRPQQMLGTRSLDAVVPISLNMFVSDGPDARYVVFVYALQEDIATCQSVMDRFMNSIRFSTK